MILTKITIAVAVVIYLTLTVVAFANGADGLRNLLIIPIILAILVGAGNLMQGFMGIPGKSPKFRKPEDDDQQ